MSLIHIIWLMVVAVADVMMVDPNGHQNYTNYDVILLSWMDTGVAPLLSDFSNYTFVLCTGSNENITAVQTLRNQTKVSNNAIELPLSVEFTDVYFIQIFAAGPRYYSIHYSERFIVYANGTLKDDEMDNPPPAVTVDLKYRPSSVATVNSKYFTIPYDQQKTLGTVRYAPMQPTVPVVAPTRRWTGLSSRKLTSKYHKMTGSPDVAYTITQPNTRSIETLPNTIRGELGPTGGHGPLITEKPTKRTKTSTDSSS